MTFFINDPFRSYNEDLQHTYQKSELSRKRFLKHRGWKQILNVNHFICATWGLPRPTNWSLKGCGFVLAWTLVVMVFFFSNQAAENPIISNNPITFPSDSAAQIQGWICGLARFTDRLLKREATMSNFLAACALPGFGVRGWHDHWEVG